MNPMTRLLKMIASALLVTAVCVGCGKPSLSGTYVTKETWGFGSKDNIRFFKNGKWTSDSGPSGDSIGGDYSIEGKTVLLQGAFGFSETGEIQGDEIVFAKHTPSFVSAADPRKMTFKKQ